MDENRARIRLVDLFYRAKLIVVGGVESLNRLEEYLDREILNGRLRAEKDSLWHNRIKNYFRFHALDFSAAFVVYYYKARYLVIRLLRFYSKEHK